MLVLAEPCQVAWHWILELRGEALTDLQSASRPIFSDVIVH